MKQNDKNEIKTGVPKVVPSTSVSATADPKQEDEDDPDDLYRFKEESTRKINSLINRLRHKIVNKSPDSQHVHTRLKKLNSHFALGKFHNNIGTILNKKQSKPKHEFSNNSNFSSDSSGSSESNSIMESFAPKPVKVVQANPTPDIGVQVEKITRTYLEKSMKGISEEIEKKLNLLNEVTSKAIAIQNHQNEPQTQSVTTKKPYESDPD